MQIPSEVVRDPPARTLAWVADHVGASAEVMAVERMPGAYASAVHGVSFADRKLVLRRWWRGNGPAIIAGEASILDGLAATAIPAPVLVASDPYGIDTDVPALLMTRLTGTPLLAPSDLDVFLDGLVGALRTIHAVPTDLGGFRTWTERSRVPAWATDADAWLRAIDAVRSPVPAPERVFLHRDFHPGNVLWNDGGVSGVVDWTYACGGPVAADVAHCRTNLNLLFGLDVADEFARRYGAVPDLAWFDLADVVSMASDDLDVWRWHDAGRPDLSAELIAERHEAFLANALSRLA
jgi:aminoglycoside phosphotransferase (APT) family kinase protein